MTDLKFFSILNHPQIATADALDPEAMRRDRSILIYSRDRPTCSQEDCPKCATKDSKKLSAHDLIRLKATGGTAAGDGVDGVFRLSAIGCKAGIVYGHPSHFKGFADGDPITLDACHATASDCVDWLKNAPDPEREALGHLLKVTLGIEEDAQEAVRSSNANLVESRQLQETARSTHEAAAELRDAARIDREAAGADRRKGMIYAVAGFIFGAILDIGMIEEKTGFTIPAGMIGALAALALILFVIAPAVARSGHLQ